MWTYIILLLFIKINASLSVSISWSKPQQIAASVDKYLTSDLVRTRWAAHRTKFNWNDFSLEKERLEEKYPPHIDVSYGTPSFMPAMTVVRALVEVASNQSDHNSFKIHQYERSVGNINLVKTVAKFYSPLMKRNINPMREILITAGSLNSLDLAGRAYIDPGDEVIVFEPFYFHYRNHIILHGGKLIPVPLRVIPGKRGHNSCDWTFDKIELESKINKKTKIIWINNPNNPIGKIYTVEELTIIANLAKKYNLLVLSDEAAQWYIYEGNHTRIATLPGMFERTLTLTSGGKTFSNTGWRIAWVIAPEPLLWPLTSLIEPAISDANTPLQIAFALGMEEELKLLGTPQSHFFQVRKRSAEARDLLVSMLRGVGAHVINPSAGYCVVANFSKLINQVDLSVQNDRRPGMRLYKHLLVKHRLATYPMSLLYSEQNMWHADSSIRFTFFKTIETLKELGDLLFKIFKPK